MSCLALFCFVAVAVAIAAGFAGPATAVAAACLLLPNYVKGHKQQSLLAGRSG